MSKGSKRRLVLSRIGLVVGIALVLYPLLTDVIASYRANQQITHMESALPEDAETSAQIAQAELYNRSLVGPVDAEPLPYEEQLTGQAPYMGWLEIPKIDVSLPVYHGTSEETLANGVGHVKGTSLPVGGVPSNCALSAHSGLQTARMFDDVRRLEVGDKLAIHVLGRHYAYRVESSEVVEPSDVSHLYVYDDGSDMLTLVTCTPLGINSHRLLVHCSRCEYDPADFATVPISAYANSRTVPPILVGLVLMSPSVMALVFGRRRKRDGGED